MTDLKKIVRISKVDLKGERKLIVELPKIKGVGFMYANAILNALNLDPNERLGNLNDEKLNLLREAIEHPEKYHLPVWMLNRRVDPVTGETKQLIGTDIGLTLREDIKRMQLTKSYKGYRHGAGLKVRGQKTKSHPRKGRALGVTRKKLMPGAPAPTAAAAAAAPAKAKAAAGEKKAEKAAEKAQDKKAATKADTKGEKK